MMLHGFELVPDDHIPDGEFIMVPEIPGHQKEHIRASHRTIDAYAEKPAGRESMTIRSTALTKMARVIVGTFMNEENVPVTMHIGPVSAADLELPGPGEYTHVDDTVWKYEPFE